MSKKKRNNTSRAPTGKRSGVFLCDQRGFEALILGGGYRRLNQCPEVQMCANVYANLIASMTLHLLENTDKGDKRVKNGLSRRLDIEPNPLMTHQTFFTAIVRTMILEGNQVTLPVYGADGRLEALWPVPPSRVSFRGNGTSYKVLIDGEPIDPEELLHFPLCPDDERPWMGQGFKIMLRDVIKAIELTNQTKNALMSSPKPSIIIKVDGYSDELKDPEKREKLANRFLTSSESGKPWMIPADAIQVEQVKPLTLNDLAIRDSLMMDKRTIAAAMTMPPFLVGAGEFKAAEFDWFVSTQLATPARIIEQELTRKLLISPDMYWHFNNRSLMNYDIRKIVEAGSEMVDRMALRRNEWREWLGLPPDADMDELLALENFVPADRLGDQKKLKKQKGGGKDEDQDG